jgi:teichuronic acid biosynthesis glycosyltransferase TuaG
MSNRPLVSVITPAFNAADTISETIESVLAQSLPFWEMLIVDDGSTDDTERIVAGYAERESRVRLIRLESNTGTPGCAKNAAIPSAFGEYLAFLDADDRWASNKLEKQLDRMQTESADLSYTGGWLIDDKSECIGRFEPSYGTGWLFDLLLAQYEINNQSVMVRRQAVNALAMPYFNPRITIGEDCDFFMRIARDARVVGIPDPLVYYRVHRGSISFKRLSQAHEGLEEVLRWVRLDPELARKCARGIRKAEAKVRFYKAKAAMAVGETVKARELMWPAALSDWRYAALTMATLSPRLWRWCLSFGQRSL